MSLTFLPVAKKMLNLRDRPTRRNLENVLGGRIARKFFAKFATTLNQLLVLSEEARQPTLVGLIRRRFYLFLRAEAFRFKSKPGEPLTDEPVSGAGPAPKPAENETRESNQ